MNRSDYLNSISEITINGQLTRKIDFIGTVSIYGWQYFNVYRRYNSVYEIVIEDYNGDFHFHKDYTVRQSIQRILCLTNEQTKDMYTLGTVSYKTQSNVSTDVTNLHWSEIQQRWQGASMNMGGCLEGFHAVSHQMYRTNTPVLQEEPQPIPPQPIPEELPTWTPIHPTESVSPLHVKVLRSGKVIPNRQ
jgi:hypothetical protein